MVLRKLVKNEYDVIVVGAGPAGSTTAERCAENGLSVLLLEKRQEIGAPVRCGEGVSQKNMTDLGMKIPDHTWRQRIKGAYVYAPNGKEIKIRGDNTDGYILERKAFDKWLAHNAAKKGAMVMTKSTVIDLILEKTMDAAGDTITSVKGVKASIGGDYFEIGSKVVVAADGVESMILRKAGIRSQKKLHLVDSAFQYLMCNVKNRDPEMIEIWLGEKITPRGYIWNFPKGHDSANVGIGVGGIWYGKTAKQFLDEWIETQEWLEGGSVIETVCGCVPVGGLWKDMARNGILGVGDAVNMVNPIHGGGIAESIFGGRIAGDIIAEAIKKGDISKKGLQPYNDRWWKERGENLSKIESVREMFEKLSDEEMNILADILSGEDLEDLARGKNVVKLATLYTKFQAKRAAHKISSAIGSYSEPIK
ncbi:MAG: NAD(P)/FAD-dependent oxidoreductase [Candidatus Aenigmarchaeota archaeon]|nr:NAD(P)/FAD-dependent oxidoreductase [Candidatus Aenigmarchaeota archaeon]